MVYILTQLSKYLLIILMAVYTFQAFTALSVRKSDQDRRMLFRMQRTEILVMLLTGISCLYAVTEEALLLPYGAACLVLLIFIVAVYGLVYKNAPRQLLNNMCMLLTIGFIIQARLDLSGAVRQLFITAAAAFGMILVPLLIRKLTFLDRLTWLYAGIGIAVLALVAVSGSATYGAKLSVSIGGVSLQPSEFIKIIYVFFIASVFAKSTDFKTVVKATAAAAAHVLILVVSKDLGAALLFFMVYLVMLYVATRKARYLFAGAGAGTAACVAAYFLFSHVRTRVIAWQDPFSVINDAGYQVAQSLFAIGSGGWMGTGLGQGLPTAIPVVEEDFVFSAVCEELGGFFAVCMILVFLCCYILILNIAMQTHRLFHKMIALGLGTVYIFQVFLTVGGAIKFIPSTGVTLPFISSGGSSMVSTFLLFNIILGLYLFRVDERSREEEEQAALEEERAASERAQAEENLRRRGMSGAKKKRRRREPEMEDPVVTEVMISKRLRRPGEKRRTHDTDRIRSSDTYLNLEVTIDPDEIEDFRVDLEDDE